MVTGPNENPAVATAQRLDAAQKWHTVAMALFLAMSTARLVSESSFGETVVSLLGVVLVVVLGAVGYQLHCARKTWSS